MKTFMENNLPVFALGPDVDRYNGDPNTDIYNLAKYDEITFLLAEGAGGSGKVTLTVEECDDTTPSNSTAIAFDYRVLTSADSSNAWGSWNRATTAGVTPDAGANKMVAVRVRAAELSDGYPYVRMVLTEETDSPVDAAVIAILSNPRYAREVMPSAVA